MKKFLCIALMLLFKQLAFSQWSAQTSGVTSALFGVYFVHPDTGFAVGAYGVALRTYDGGTNWTALTTGTSGHLESVFFINSKVGVAVGNSGLIIRTSDGGNSWTTIPSGTIINLNAVAFNGPLNGFIAGADLKTTDGGLTWNTYSTPSSVGNDIKFANSTYGFGVGIGFMKTQDGGTTWQAGTTPDASAGGRALFFTSGDVGYVGTYTGKVKKTTDGGTTWTEVASLVPAQINDIVFVNAATGYLINDIGQVYKTTNAGITWNQESVSPPGGFQTISFPSSSVGYVVGNYGAIYKNVSIPTPSISFSSNLNSFSTVVGTPSSSQNFTVSGSDLTADLVITASANFEVSLSSSSGFGSNVNITPVAGTVASTPIYVRYNPSIAGTHNGYIYLATNGGSSQDISVSGSSVNPGTPLISTSGSLTPFNTTLGTPSANQSFTVSATDLSSNITVTAPTNFEVSLSSGSGFGVNVSLVPSGGTLSNTPVYVRYNPSATGTHSGIITLESTGAVSQSVSVDGTCTPAPTSFINFIANLTTFLTEAGTASPAQSFTVSGNGLVADIFVNAPTNFEVSFNSGSGYANSINLTPTNGIITNTTIYIRYNPAVYGLHTGNISLTSTDAATKFIPVKGMSNNPGTEIYTSGSLSPFSTDFGTPSFSRFIGVSGVGLLSDIVVAAPDNFEIALSSISSSYVKSITLPRTGTFISTTKIYVRYNPLAIGSHVDTLGLASTGAITKELSLFGVTNDLTGIAEASKSNILLYPNPSNGNMTLEYNFQASDGSFELIDLMGRKLLNYKLGSGANKLVITEQNLNSGIYFYQVKVGESLIAKDKIIINR